MLNKNDVHQEKLHIAITACYIGAINIRSIQVISFRPSHSPMVGSLRANPLIQT